MLALGEQEGAMVDICFLYLPGFSCLFFCWWRRVSKIPSIATSVFEVGFYIHLAIYTAAPLIHHPPAQGF